MMQRPNEKMSSAVLAYIEWLENWVVLQSKSDDFGMALTYKKKLQEANQFLNSQNINNAANALNKDDKTVEKIKLVTAYSKELLESIQWVRETFAPEEELNEKEKKQQLAKIPLIEQSAK